MKKRGLRLEYLFLRNFMKQMKDSSGSPKNHKTSSKLRFNKKWQKVFWVFYWIFFDYYVWISTWKFINAGIHFFVWVQHFVNRSVKKKGGKYFSWEEKLHILKWSLSWDVFYSFFMKVFFIFYQHDYCYFRAFCKFFEGNYHKAMNKLRCGQKGIWRD